MTLIRLDQVHKHFTNVQALQDLTLTLNPGEVLGLFGHNGAGKTQPRLGRGIGSEPMATAVQ